MNSLWEGLVSDARTEKSNNVTTLRDLWIQTDQCLGWKASYIEDYTQCGVCLHSLMATEIQAYILLFHFHT